MTRLLNSFFGGLMTLSAIGMVATFVVIMLGVLVRQIGVNVPGLDAYAGYCIAAVLFLALPDTLRRGEHIRVTLVIERLPAASRHVVELACLATGLALAGYMTWFAADLVYTSRRLHDVSPAADATPLWIPQLVMALGCLGLAVAFAEAFVTRLFGGASLVPVGQEAMRAE